MSGADYVQPLHMRGGVWRIRSSQTPRGRVRVVSHPSLAGNAGLRALAPGLRRSGLKRPPRTGAVLREGSPKWRATPKWGERAFPNDSRLRASATGQADGSPLTKGMTEDGLRCAPVTSANLVPATAGDESPTTVDRGTFRSGRNPQVTDSASTSCPDSTDVTINQPVQQRYLPRGPRPSPAA